jgi:hypothetical protein
MAFDFGIPMVRFAQILFIDIVVNLEAEWSPHGFYDVMEIHERHLSGTDLLFSRTMLWRKD